MKMIPIPGSSKLAAIGYDQDQEVLVAQFPNGALYRYNGVPPDSFVAVITNKESTGKAFNAHIERRGFPVEKVDAEAVLGI